MLLNYNYGFWRETELFGRSLYIKYYKKATKNDMEGVQKKIGFDGAEEGEIEPDDGDDPSGGGFVDDDQADDPNVAIVDDDEALGPADMMDLAPAAGLHNLQHIQSRHNATNMFRKRMYAQLRRGFGAPDDGMQLDQFKIRRRVDVMQLKKTFKDYIMPKL